MHVPERYSKNRLVFVEAVGELSGGARKKVLEVLTGLFLSVEEIEAEDLAALELLDEEAPASELPSTIAFVDVTSAVTEESFERLDALAKQHGLRLVQPD